MRAGPMRYKLVFESAGDNVDTNSQPLNTPWTPYYTCWGSVKPTAAGESVLDDQRVATRNHVISIRYKTGIKTTDRILLEGRYLQIKGLTDVDNRHKEWLIDATEIYV